MSHANVLCILTHSAFVVLTCFPGCENGSMLSPAVDTRESSGHPSTNGHHNLLRRRERWFRDECWIIYHNEGMSLRHFINGMNLLQWLCGWKHTEQSSSVWKRHVQMARLWDGVWRLSGISQVSGESLHTSEAGVMFYVHMSFTCTIAWGCRNERKKTWCLNFECMAVFSFLCCKYVCRKKKVLKWVRCFFELL